MAGVQSMCARVGMVTGRGLMPALAKRFPRPVLVLVALALFLANTFNVGADLTGMADASEVLTGLDSRIGVAILGALIGGATILLRYRTIARVLKVLALALLSYVVAAFTLHPHWGQVARATFVPSLPPGRAAWSMVVAILGTTISPYLFFWQAAQEVEEEKSKGRKDLPDREGASRDELRLGRYDVGFGTFAANVTFFFITLTTALTLHAHGITSPQSSREVASALTPLAGSFATSLFTIGILGTGALAIPTLAGSAAYAVAELLGWKEGMDEKARHAPGFYAVFALSMVVAVVMDFAGFNAVQAMFLSAVVNGVLAPFLLVGILMVASDRTIMRGQPSAWLGRIVVGLTAAAMFVSAALMFL